MFRWPPLVSGLEELLGFVILRNENESKMDTRQEIFIDKLSGSENVSECKKEERNEVLIANQDLLLREFADKSDNINIEGESNQDTVVDLDELESEKDEENDMMTAHHFEILPGKNTGVNSPGVLFVDNSFKFLYKKELKGKFFYFCEVVKPVRCPARAHVQRDDATGQFHIIKCATNKVHNHAPSTNKAQELVRKMTKEMMEMIEVKILNCLIKPLNIITFFEVDLSLTIQDCFTKAKEKFRQETDDHLWEDVLAHWSNPVKMKSLRRSLSRARRHALGLTESLGSHMKQLEARGVENIWWYRGTQVK